MIRAVLLAMATVARRAGLRANIEFVHASDRSGYRFTCRTRAVMPVISNRRRYLSPILVILPMRSLPPLDRLSGVIPGAADIEFFGGLAWRISRAVRGGSAGNRACAKHKGSHHD